MCVHSHCVLTLLLLASLSSAACSAVDVLTTENEVIHMLMDTAGEPNSGFVQLKQWVDL